MWPGLETTLKSLLANAQANTGLLWLLPQLDPRPSLEPLLEQQERVSRSYQAIQDYTKWTITNLRWQQAQVKLQLLELQWIERHFAFEQGKETEQILLAWEAQWLSSLKQVQQAQAAHNLARLHLTQNLAKLWQDRTLTAPSFNLTKQETVSLEETIAAAQANRPEWYLLRWVKHTDWLKNGNASGSVNN